MLAGPCIVLIISRGSFVCFLELSEPQQIILSPSLQVLPIGYDRSNPRVWVIAVP